MWKTYALKSLIIIMLFIVFIWVCIKNPYISMILLGVLLFFIYANRVSENCRKIPQQPRLYSPYCEQSQIKDYITNSQTTDVIWSFWHSEECPTTVNLCLKTWRMFEPTYTICMLSEKTLKNFITSDELPTNFNSFAYQLKADIVRLVLMEKYGGIWLDASIILTQPNAISRTWGSQNYDLGAYYLKQYTTNHNNPPIEYWFLSAPKHSPLVKDWKEEVYRVIETYNDYADYYTDIKNEKIDCQLFDKHSPTRTLKRYFLLYYCYLKITNSNHYKTKYVSGDSEDGPLDFLAYYGYVGGIIKPFELMFTKHSNDALSPPIIKLVGGQRKLCEKLLNYCSANSLFGKLMASN